MLLPFIASFLVLKNELDSNNGIKYEMYRQIRGNSDGSIREYLDIIQNGQLRRILAQFRTGSHFLQIEVGRWVPDTKVDTSKRVCRCCQQNQIETESHSKFSCPNFDGIRQQFSHLFNGTDDYNLGYFFNFNSHLDVARYLKACLEIRNFTV